MSSARNIPLFARVVLNTVSSAVPFLRSEQKIYNRKREYNRSERNILAKARKRQRMFDLYEQLQDNNKYEKGMLLESEKVSKQHKNVNTVTQRNQNIHKRVPQKIQFGLCASEQNLWLLETFRLLLTECSSRIR